MITEISHGNHYQALDYAREEGWLVKRIGNTFFATRGKQKLVLKNQDFWWTWALVKWN